MKGGYINTVLKADVRSEIINNANHFNTSFMKEYVYTTDVNGGLSIAPETIKWLYNITKWTKFLSILGFAVVILIALALLSINTVFTSMNFYQMPNGDIYQSFFSGYTPWVFIGVALIMLFIYAIPLYFLYKFSSKMKLALDTNDTPSLTSSIHYLENYYLYIGALTVIYLVLMVLAIILAAIGF